MASVKPSNKSFIEETPRAKTPFLARTYGGFTSEQESFYRAHVRSARNQTILDPMGGQGFTLSKLAHEGAHLWLGDINPGPLHLAMLRDPRLLNQSTNLASWFRSWVRPFQKNKRAAVLEYVDDWIAPQIRDALNVYVEKLSLEADLTPFSYASNFWSLPINLRFAACLPILAARSLTCFRGSDNVTWLKKGGLLRQGNIYDALMQALDLWCRFAEQTVAKSAGSPLGAISVRRMNAEKGLFGEAPLADLIITSPPYANRLDYTRMWAPELEVLAAMWKESSSEIKSTQIGSTVVEGKHVLSKEEMQLPKTIRQSLFDIRNDADWKASESYYYPFFRNYAISMMRSLKQIENKLLPGGILVVFVRDTVRKDIMFPTAELVRSVLVRGSKMKLLRTEKKVVRTHVGLLRKSSSSGMYGLAQLEWWLAFRKSEKA
jgi:hypothetical protein